MPTWWVIGRAGKGRTTGATNPQRIPPRRPQRDHQLLRPGLPRPIRLPQVSGPDERPPHTLRIEAMGHTSALPPQEPDKSDVKIRGNSNVK